MNKPVLVVMAAGIGSRFGGGIKQLAKTGPNGEIILDLSIEAAIRAGFKEAVFIIRRSIDTEFKELIGDKFKNRINIKYVYQDDKFYVDKNTLLPNRNKPWGTGHAILMCKDIIDEPFLVINADDYYGIKIYKEMYEYLKTNDAYDKDGIERYYLAGYHLANTLSDNGTVTRGVCKVDSDNNLISIKESYELSKSDDKIEGYFVENNIKTDVKYDLNEITSMNMWGIYPTFFDFLETKFKEFCKENGLDNTDAEFLLPKVINDKITSDKLKVKVVETVESWFGVTYPTDVDIVRSKIKDLFDKGLF